MSHQELVVNTTTIESTDAISEVSNLREEEISFIQSYLAESLRAYNRQQDAVMKTFNWALDKFAYANPSDIWYHGIYRQYIGDDATDTSALQRWRAVSGNAFVSFIKEYYEARFPEYIELYSVTAPEVKEHFERLGGTEYSASDIADIAIVGEFQNKRQVFGGITCLTSFKGRLTEYVDGSEVLLQNGLFSPVITLDVFTNMDSIENRGELQNEQVRRKPARLVEEEEKFSNLYSFNSRTDETTPQRQTNTVQTVSAPLLFDEFVEDTLNFWNQHTNSIRTNNTLTLTD